MLNGTAPVIIFKIYPKVIKWKPGVTDDLKLLGTDMKLKDWQNLAEWKKLLYYTPIPIPIYLDENFTQIAVDEADQTITADVAVAGNMQYETPLTNDVSISLVATRDNTIMMMLLSVIKQLLGLLAGQRYSITLYYDAIFVLNGSIKHISQQTVSNTNKKLVQLIITERPQNEEAKSNAVGNVGGTEFGIGG